jgi:hypothetical protein
MGMIRTLVAASALALAAGTANAAVVTVTFDSAVANYTPTPGTLQNVKNEFAPLGFVFADQKTPGQGATLGQCGPGDGPVSLFGFGVNGSCGDYYPNLDIDFVNPGNSALDGYTTFFSIMNYDGTILATAYDALGAVLGTTQNYSGALTFSGIGNISRVNLKSTDGDATTLDTLQFEAVIGVPAPGGPNAVPEPATWAMMIGGFAIVGASMRRRQAVAVSFA